MPSDDPHRAQQPAQPAQPAWSEQLQRTANMMDRQAQHLQERTRSADGRAQAQVAALPRIAARPPIVPHGAQQQQQQQPTQWQQPTQRQQPPQSPPQQQPQPSPPPTQPSPPEEPRPWASSVGVGLVAVMVLAGIAIVVVTQRKAGTSAAPPLQRAPEAPALSAGEEEAMRSYISRLSTELSEAAGSAASH